MCVWLFAFDVSVSVDSLLFVLFCCGAFGFVVEFVGVVSDCSSF